MSDFVLVRRKVMKKIISCVIAIAVMLSIVIVPTTGVNNSAETAIEIPLDGSVSGEGWRASLASTWATNTKVTPGTPDEIEQWFKITTPSSGLLYFDVDYEYEIVNTSNPSFTFYYHDDDNVRHETNSLYFAGSGQSSSASASSGVQELTSNRFRLPAGTYYIQMHTGKRQNYNTGIWHEYTITPRFTPEDDGFRHGFNDTREKALPLAVNTPIIGNLNYNRNSSYYDSHWYIVEAPHDGTMQVRVDFVDQPLDIFFRHSVYPSGVQNTVVSFYSETGYKLSNAREIKAGDKFYVRVIPQSTAADAAARGYFNSDYKLTVLLTFDCDNHEPPASFVVPKCHESAKTYNCKNCGTPVQVQPPACEFGRWVEILPATTKHPAVKLEMCINTECDKDSGEYQGRELKESPPVIECEDCKNHTCPDCEDCETHECPESDCEDCKTHECPELDCEDCKTHECPELDCEDCKTHECPEPDSCNHNLVQARLGKVLNNGQGNLTIGDAMEILKLLARMQSAAGAEIWIAR